MIFQADLTGPEIASMEPELQYRLVQWLVKNKRRPDIESRATWRHPVTGECHEVIARGMLLGYVDIDGYCVVWIDRGADSEPAGAELLSGRDEFTEGRRSWGRVLDDFCRAWADADREFAAPVNDPILDLLAEFAE